VIRLVRPDVYLLAAAIAGDRALAVALGRAVVPGWATFRDALPRTRAALAAAPEGTPWGPRLFLSGEPPELVGWGGFKGPPQAGAVELGYEIAEARCRRGLATAAVRAMVEEALAHESVRAVIAHTLPERNASNRVLEKAGFQFEREVRGVWRFELTGARYSQRSDSGSGRMRSTRAGAPATTALSGTSLVTTVEVPMIALSPTVTPRRMQAP
jgi:ribosomal-protein-alanine N-acetyltransferase